MHHHHHDQIQPAAYPGECAVMHCPNKPSTRANDPSGGPRAICRYHYRRIIAGRLCGWFPRLSAPSSRHRRERASRAPTTA